MKFKNSFLILSILFIFILFVGSVSANELENNETVATVDNVPIEIEKTDEGNLELGEENENEVNDMLGSPNEEESTLGIPSEVIVVEDWNELKYYCSLSDKDYVLKLKENTNYYPSNLMDKSYQIKVNNKVTILGSSGAYIGDSSSNPGQIRYTAFVVPDDTKASLTIDNVTFKFIRLLDQPDGIFIKMAGNKNNVIKNCRFENINMEWGHSCIVYLKKGTATLQNCSFIKCTTCFGCVSIYDPNSYTSAHMTMKDCYFEDNYASTEPGCINNCGIIEIFNTTFYKNRSYWWGGAIHTHICANTTVYNSHFIDNVAGWNGGAIYTYSWLQIYNSTFIGNNCTTDNGGGAIGACTSGSSPHIYIENSVFTNNQNKEWSSGRGGAISIMDDGSIEVLNSTFIENSAKTGSAICAWSQAGYGSPSVIITGNKFINHTRTGDVLNVRVSGTPAIISNNEYLNNSIVFSTLSLESLEVGKQTATLKINSSLSNPNYYDPDILDRTSYKVYVNDVYQKTVNITTFELDFGDLDICDVYVVPTIGSSRTNIVTLISTREYIFTSKSKGNDSNNGLTRDTPVNSLSKAIELAKNYKNIILMDGTYDEGELNIDYDLTIKGESNATMTGNTIFRVNTDNFILKNLIIENLTCSNFIKQNTGKIEITKIIFKNNNVGSLFDVNSILNVSNSVFINNSNIVTGNIGNIDLDCNWWGNTNENYNTAPNSFVNNWLYLNISSANDKLELNQKTTLKFDFDLINKEGSITKDTFNLPEIELQLSSFNGNINKNIVKPYDNVIYTLNATSDGSVTAEFNQVTSTHDFTFIKTNPVINAVVQDVYVGSDVIVEVTVPSDAAGNVTIQTNGITQTQTINNTKIVFNLGNLPANEYTLTTTYNGDNHYNTKTATNTFKVNKFDSTTVLSVGEIKVRQDVTITVTVPNDASGNVTIWVNGKPQTLNVNNSEVKYIIPEITRGDYIINATYNGDGKYLSSSDSFVFDVDKLNTTFTANVNNIIYGEKTIIEVTLNDNTTGTVTASIDGKTNTSQILNGKASITLQNIDAGINKTVDLFYSGDNTYLKKNITICYDVFKADFKFNLTVSDVMIGEDVIVILDTPLNIGGNFTITCRDSQTIDASPFGQTTYIIPDLDVGEYDITVVYNGDNYNTCSEESSFKVLEYAKPEWQNDGFDMQNTGKTNYTSDVREGIIWTANITSSKNIVIDSEGNIYIICEDGIYSFDNNGVLRWVYPNSGVNGNFSGLSVSRDVVIAPKSGDTLYFINQTTGLKYGSSNIYQASSEFAPIVDGKSNIYVVSELQEDTSTYNLVIVPYKAWEYGGELKIISLGNYKPLASPTIVDDNLVVVLSQSRLRLIDITANKVIFTKSSSNFQPVRPVVDEGKNIYAVQGDSIVAYSVTGSQLWKTKVTGGVGDKLYFNKDIYAINSKGNLYKYNVFTGKESLVSDIVFTSDVLIDGADTLYIGSDNTLYAIKDDEVVWSLVLNSTIVNTPVMDKNGIIYLTTGDALYAVSKNPLVKTSVSVICIDGLELTGVLKDQEGNAIEGGEISYTLNNGSVLKTTTDSNGEFTITVNNNCIVCIVFEGDDFTLPCNSSIVLKNICPVQVDTQIIAENPFTRTAVDYKAGERGYMFYFTLKDENGNPLANKQVKIGIDGKIYTVRTDNEGKAGQMINMPSENSYTYALCFLGDEDYKASFAVSRLIVVKKAVTITPAKTSYSFSSTAKTKTITATLKSTNSYIPKGKQVTLTIAGKTFKATIGDKGQISFNIGSVTKKGTYKVTVKFAGTVTYNSASSNTITVKIS